MSRLFNRRWKVGLITVGLLAIAGFAYAYWTTSGTGTGTAETADADAITINQTTAVAGLFPGGPAEALSGNFDNSNPSGVFVNTIDATISDVSGPNIAPETPCTAADYQLNGFPITVGTEIPSGTGVGAWTGGSIQMLSTAENQNGCKDATVTISYTAAG